jgi:hypothetical protein
MSKLKSLATTAFLTAGPVVYLIVEAAPRIRP